MSFYKAIIRPLFFKVDPETVHYKAIDLLNFVMKLPFAKYITKSMFIVDDPKLKRTVFGIDFPNPVGLAAGFDKNAVCFKNFSRLGFGFIEIGTVTPKGQEGNPKKRLFRLLDDKAIINRMGFNNEGVEAVVNRLKKNQGQVIIGGNLGKNKLTPNENAMDDYEISFNALYSYVDYFVVNVSSPNTPNLRDLQEKDPLKKILNRLKSMDNQKGASKPILLKIAPDLTNTQLDDIIEIVTETNIDGIIATNTTISRADLKTPSKTIEEIGNGGLSGSPLKERSTEVIRYIANKSNKSFPIIGVGGIYTAEDAFEKMEAGADLVQVYSGFIYEGPKIVKNINKGLLKLLK
jgi:dihydroorotate dehydrogenase